MTNEKLKKYAAIAGKSAFTALCPPIGLAAFFAPKNKQVGAVVLGMLASLAVSAGITRISKSLSYDSPNFSVYAGDHIAPDSFNAAVALVSPALYTLALAQPGTRIDVKQVEGRPYEVFIMRSSDVISFDKERQEYFVNMDPSLMISPSKYIYESNSIAAAELKVAHAKDRLDEAIKCGNIDLAKRCNIEYRKSLDASEDAKVIYSNARSLVSRVVDEMNSELKSLGSTKILHSEVQTR